MSAGTMKETAPRDHAVQFYDREADLVDLVGGYLSDALRHGGTAVVASKSDHAMAFQQALRVSGIDPAKALASGRLIVLDASEISFRLTESGALDAGVFEELVGQPVRQAAAGGGPLHVFGEIVAVLWDAGQVLAAIELEEMWNGLRQEIPFSLLCAYPAPSVSDPRHEQALRDVCRLHSSVTGFSEGTSIPSDGPTWAGRRRVRRFSSSPTTPRDARHFVVETLRQWGGDALIADASLLASELVTNAVVHAWTDVTVGVSQRDDAVRIAIHDGSPDLPSPRESSSTAVTGRGLMLVDRIASRWGSEALARGKTVWAELDHAKGRGRPEV